MPNRDADESCHLYEDQDATSLNQCVEMQANRSPFLAKVGLLPALTICIPLSIPCNEALVPNHAYGYSSPIAEKNLP